MILAAGLGTRLRPLTDHVPKALVPVDGVPMLERVARRLIAAGADRLIINIHYMAEQIRAFVEERDGFGVEVLLSEEPERRLETGGGLRNAARHFRKDAPFFMHNADIVTEIDLSALYESHLEAGDLATLSVRRAETPRFLLLDGGGRFCGYGNAETGAEHLACDAPEGLQRADFLGVQVISPRIFEEMTEEGVFSIMDVYFRLTRAGARIGSYRDERALWIDIGNHERLEQARRHFAGRGETPQPAAGRG